ncbi:hypothetical protein Tco_1192149 [Tanacetum coccineum]
MTTLKFADTHNMVAFLSKPAESDGFEQIVDFLNAQPIRYALTVNPTIYISCIEQFWSTGVVKTINGEVQLHALVDGKKIIISEASVRRDLKLEDEEGIDCLPNSTIFEQLALMGYEKISQKLTFYKPFFSPQWKFLIHTILQCLSSKTTAWNEFSSTMASAIICLATNQKFNFSKYIFESMVRNLDNVSGKFLMYPRFVQVFLEQQLDDLSTHNRIYVAPSHTKKIFANMRRVGKGFSGRVTPLFPTIVVPQPSDSTDNVADETVHKELGDSLVVVPGAKKPWGILLLKLEYKCTQHNEIASLKRRVKKLENKNRSRTHRLKRLYKVGFTARVESSDNEESLGEDASKQGRINAIDAYEEITLVSVYDVNVSASEEVFATTVDDITLAQVLEEIKSTKPKKKWVVIQELGESTTTISSQLSSQQSHDKCKGILIKPVKPMNKKYLIRLDEETALNLQAKFEEEE